MKKADEHARARQRHGAADRLHHLGGDKVASARCGTSAEGKEGQGDVLAGVVSRFLDGIGFLPLADVDETATRIDQDKPLRFRH